MVNLSVFLDAFGNSRMCVGARVCLKMLLTLKFSYENRSRRVIF